MIRVCRRYGAVFSVVLTSNAAVQGAIDSIPEDAWTPVKYPGAVPDPRPAPGSQTPKSLKPPTP